MTIFSMFSSAHRSRSAAFAGIIGLWLSAFAGQAVAAEKAAFLLPGSINDQSWNAQGYQGAEKLKAIGWEVAYTENVPAADMVEALRDYARKDYNVVVGHTGRFLDADHLGANCHVAPLTVIPVLARVSGIEFLLVNIGSIGPAGGHGDGAVAIVSQARERLPDNGHAAGRQLAAVHAGFVEAELAVPA